MKRSLVILSFFFMTAISFAQDDTIGGGIDGGTPIAGTPASGTPTPTPTPAGGLWPALHIGGF